MNNDRTPPTARHRPLRPALLALGLACAAGAAFAQAPQAPAGAERVAPPAPPANPDAVDGVTVKGSRPDTGPRIPDDKKAEYDAEVAREAAFRAYRESAPRVTADDKGVANPNDLSKDFPGLKSYAPK